MSPQPLIERYRDRLSLEPGDPVVTLNEGSTPLIESHVISERVGARVLLKFEGANPTGSFKDRGMTVAVSRAKGAGAEAVICASTGNTAASAAAYAARGGMRGAVIVPEGKIAVGKLAQALIHGARVIALRGNFDDALRIVRDLAAKHPIELVNSVNPYRIRARRRRPTRSATSSAPHPTRSASRSATPATSPPGGPGFREYDAAPVPLRLPGRGRRAPRPSATRSRSRRRSPRRSGSATRRAGRRRWTRSPPRAAGSPRSPTTRSSTPTASSPTARASSASPPRPPRSPASSPTAPSTPRANAIEGTIVCVLTGHGLKDPDTALGKAPSVLRAEADLAAVEKLVFD